MKIITLSGGQAVMVDDEDFDRLNEKRWYAIKGKHTCYAAASCGGYSENKRGIRILMHRIILNTPNGMYTDHKDGNGLNNQRSNLRVATRSQNNAHHVRASAKKASKFFGVSLQRKTGKWEVKIQVNKRREWLGTYAQEIDAAKAYDKSALESFKEFAQLNFPA